MPQLSSLRNYRVICHVVLAGTYLTVAAIFTLLLISYSLEPQPQIVGRLALCSVALIYVVAAHVLLSRKRWRVVTYMLTGFYIVLAGGIVYSWGINTPIGTLTFALSIVLAGILLSARHALWAALIAAVTLLGIQLAIDLAWHVRGGMAESHFGDALAYSVIFGMLALASWLYNREMERSLAQARAAKSALQEQKDTLKIQVQKRTAQLRQAQLKEAQQMYRFAELGQLGVTMLHDLANHLTALTLEMDDLQNTGHSKAIARARRITNYLGDVVSGTRDRLNGKSQKKRFDMVAVVTNVVDFLRDRAEKTNVTLAWQPPAESWQLTGDPLSLSQVLAIIICNGIDAYPSTTTGERIVYVSALRSKTVITLRIGNYGKKITPSQQKNLFKPFSSTKKSGLGVGLFIAKKAVELQFSGTLELNPAVSHTEFVITLPRKDVA